MNRTADYPEGYEPDVIAEDLRWIKLRPEDKRFAGEMREALKTRKATVPEADRLRLIATRKRKALQVLFKSQEDVVITDAKLRVGYKEHERIASENKRANRLRLYRKLRDARKTEQAAETEMQDYGI